VRSLSDLSPARNCTACATPQELAVQEASCLLRDADVENPRLEAQLLLAHVLGVTRGKLLSGSIRTVSEEALSAFWQLVRQRANRVPLAYLRGYQEFYGLTIQVSRATLIPRPETELLVEAALNAVAAISRPVLLDLCTGSGCIAVACAVKVPTLRVVASDISEAALQVARANCQRHGVGERVALVAGDVATMLRGGWADVITVNPPYIPSAQIPTLQAEVQVHEPWLALDGGPDGLAVLQRVVADGYRVLRRGGMLATEVALGQAHEVVDRMVQHRYEKVRTLNDLAGIPRVVLGIRPR